MTTDRLELTGPWKRSIDDAPIDYVTVPGCYAPVGECTLAYDFESPWPGEDGGRLFLVTDGVLASAAFALNGEPLGTAGPWATYRFEIDPSLLRPRNTLTARVRDIVETFGPTPGRRFDAGLVRPLWIERRPRTFIASFRFRPGLSDDLSAADCVVDVDLDGPAEGCVSATLTQRDTNRLVARAEAAAGEPLRFRVEHPHLWSPEMPNLYLLHVRLGLPDGRTDERGEFVGFRRIEVRGRDFYLNHRRLVLKGVCRHEFTSAGGYSPTPEEVRRELALIRHAGFNYVRLVHSPHAPVVPRLAAELGLLVSEEPGTCFHDLGDEAVAAPAMESLRRTILRDRNLPSIFAWLIYNECNPNADYARRAAKVCRELDPDARLSFADCSGRHDEIKAMLAAGDLTYYGINVYSYLPEAYVERMRIFPDRPMVFTEWGGWMGPGNPRQLGNLCDTFVRHSRTDAAERIAGCTFWAWADYEEYTRKPPAAIEGWTIEGLVDQRARPKPDLQTLSMMCFDIDHPPVPHVPRPEVLLRAPQRAGAWRAVDLEAVRGDQEALERRIEEARWYFRPHVPLFDEMLVDGIAFQPRQGTAGHPLLLGPGREEAVIPVGREVRGVAVLGQVALFGGYPASGVWSVHHRNAEPVRQLGQDAGEYVLVFEDGEVRQPLRHGLEVLRANDICRWWKTAPRAPHTRPGVRVEIHPSYEILRFDLWEAPFPAPRVLREIRWRLRDSESIQAMLALSVLEA